jgi:hypothetical protein
MGVFRELKGYRTRPGFKDNYKIIILIKEYEFWLLRELILILKDAISEPEEPEIYPERISPVIKRAISDYQKLKIEFRRNRFLSLALSLILFYAILIYLLWIIDVSTITSFTEIHYHYSIYG